MKVSSEILSLRSACLEDSDFIYDLRSSKGKYINNEGFTRKSNKSWLSEYLKKRIRKKGILLYYF